MQSKLGRNTPGSEFVTGTEIVTVQLSGTRLSWTLELASVGLDDRRGCATRLCEVLSESHSLAPDVHAPDVLEPDVLAPDVSVPEVLAADVIAPAVLAPHVLAPKVLALDVLAQEVRTDDVLAPAVNAPDVRAPEVLALPPSSQRTPRQCELRVTLVFAKVNVVVVVVLT
jgi:hypothetical protein